ncbi:MAG TPA: hypothetical protein VMR25_26705 [Planctomycetaceae bacterium]|jgi:hypothetical protein|nr:hypothetical protein [Planctomycetaceae bacterium]
MIDRTTALSVIVVWTAALNAHLAAEAGPPIRFVPSHRTAAKTEASELKLALGRRLLDPSIPLQEIQDFVDARIPPMPEVRSAAEWDAYAKRARQQALDRAVFRGEAARWRTLPTHVEWLQTIDGGPGYKIRKLRYEAVPGLWIPALLYEPTEFKTAKVPVSLAVNGHDPAGKALAYKQLRCINQAKRGMIVLNTEYLQMGQLTGANYNHYRLNQLDLCGTSGVAPFYLVLSRGLDILLAHEHADPARVTVQGLSGGGWQTITISALDTRVTLCNAVAGYSSLHTRVRNVSDLGDSEQNPADLETVVDYAQMTAMLAPRPALLTYNFADNCCFKADHALPPLNAAARPIYELYGKPHNLRTHVNLDPGTHNFGLDNRQQFYGMLKDFFFADRTDIGRDEIPSESEVKTPEQLNVDLPAKNEDFNSVARQLAATLPRDAELPKTQDQTLAWRNVRRPELSKLVHAHAWNVVETTIAARTIGPYQERDRWLRVGGLWTLPSIEFTPPKVNGEMILLTDAGRATTSDLAESLLHSGRRVLTVDLYGFGESETAQRPALFAIAVSSVGERPLGIQCSQLVAIARWVRNKVGQAPTLKAVGPRSSLIATIAAALEPDAIGELELHGAYGSLKEVIKNNLTIEQAPELFCFGLLERFDMPQLLAMAAPRPIHFRAPGRPAQ